MYGKVGIFNRSFAVLLLLSCLLISVIASPMVGPPPPFKPPYPSLQDCKDKITAPEAGKAMYFTGLKVRKDVNTAKAYAVAHGLTHVTNQYPTGFCDLNRYEGTPQEGRQFQENFSLVYAQKTTGTAYLMLDDDKSPAADSIFNSVEFPAIENGNQVDKILRFPFTNPPADPTTSTNVFWKKPAAAPSYATGWCGLHVIQYQKPDPSKDHYKFDVTIKDANGNEIGSSNGLVVPTGQTADIDSKLPWVLLLTAGAIDNDAVLFRYAGQSWGSNDQAHHCNFGAYDSGSRNGDCGFTC